MYFSYVWWLFDKEKEQVVKAAKKLSGVTPGTTGNISIKRDDFFLTTPSGVQYNEIEPDDIAVLNLSCEQSEGNLSPTSDSIVHCKIYQNFSMARTIVHTHSVCATALSVLRESIPPFHYLMVLWGNGLPIADYATYGSNELASSVVEAMRRYNSSACLMANHGAILYSTSDDLELAIERAEQLEHLCQVYCQAKSIGNPYELSDQELDRVREKMTRYGQKNGSR